MILRTALLACAFALLTCTLTQGGIVGDDYYRSWLHAVPENIFSRMEADCRAVHDWDGKNIATLKDGKRVTRWFPINTFPRTALEEAILHLVKLADPGPSLVGFEWWIQKISEQGPLNFHVDKDEAVASLEHYLLHPLWSSVFYITTEGGGTLITNQLSPRGNGYDPVVPEEGAWSFPQENKFLRFNGTLLHGVVPGTQRGKFAKERITFLVNFWHVRPKLPNCQELPHEKVSGLTLLSKDEILELRKDYPKYPPPVPQALTVLDVRPRKKKRRESYEFRMDLPGNQVQFLQLPRLKGDEGKNGETFYLHFTSSKRIFAQAKKQEKAALKRQREAEERWRRKQKGEVVDEEEEQEEKDEEKKEDVTEKKKSAASDSPKTRKTTKKKRSQDDEEDDTDEKPRKQKSGKKKSKNRTDEDDDDENDEPKRKSKKGKKKGSKKKKSKRSRRDEDLDDDSDDEPKPKKKKKKSKSKKSKKSSTSDEDVKKAGSYSERFAKALEQKNAIKDRLK